MLQFSTDDTATLRFVGLGTSGIGTTPSDINYAVRLQGGVAEVRESGTYKSEIAFGAGDTFTITVNNGSVTYAKNGGVFYTSSSPASGALRAHAIFFDTSGSLRNVGFGGGAVAGSSPAAASAPVASTGASGYAVARPAGSTPVRKKPHY